MTNPISYSSTTPNNSVAYINGHIYTVNPSQPWAEAFIVSPSGTFEAVDSTSTILARAKSEALVIIDLKSRFIMPGIHDAHAHILYSALAATSHVRLSPELDTTAAIEELKKGQCLCKYTHINSDWIVGHGYAINKFRRQDLDEAFPDTPVMIRGGAGHNAYVNSEALRRAGYDLEKEPDEQGTTYARDADGLTGELHENAMSKVCVALPKPSLGHVKRVLGTAIGMLHRAGVTGVQEASASTILLSALRELDTDANNGLKIDVYAHTVFAPDWIAEESEASLHATIDQVERYASRHVHTQFVKIILDGVPLPPYYTHAGLKDGICDEKNLLTKDLFDAVKKYDAKGITMKVHCTGHGSTRLTLDAYAAVRKANPNGPRHEIAHCSGVHDDDYPRFKELNVTAEMSPAFFFRHPVTEASGGLMDWNFRRMKEVDAHLTIGSDWGAGSDPDILPHVSGIVKDAGGAENVIRMLTLSGAEAVGMEKELGSIEVGKKANFITVSQDLSKGEFAGAKVLGTWFEGEQVFEIEM